MSVVLVDALGRTWQVYQVRRTSETPGAVSASREGGWLAFTSDGERRRLAPFPAGWEGFGQAELAELCERADRIAVGRDSPSIERRRTPRVMKPASGPPSVDVRTPVNGKSDDAGMLSAEVQDMVQAHAGTARASGDTVIGAMITLRRSLLPFDIKPGSEVFKAARRLFLEAFYFKR